MRITPIMFLIVFFLLPIKTQAQDKLTYEEFLEKQITAYGGKVAIEAVDNMEIQVTITEGDMVMKGHYRANRDGQMRIDILIDGKLVFIEALSSSDGGWQSFNGDGVTLPLSNVGEDKLLRGTYYNLYGLHELQEYGFTIKFIGNTKLREKNYWALDITSPSGHLERWFYGKEDFLKHAILDQSALHVDVDPTKLLKLKTFSNYKMVDGVMKSHYGEQIDLNKGKVIQTYRISSFNLNYYQEKTQFIKP